MNFFYSGMDCIGAMNVSSRFRLTRNVSLIAAAGHALAGLLLNLNLFLAFAEKKENHLNYQGYAVSFLRMDYLLNGHMIIL